jgi:DNA-binding NarL/FixJ family response regulator
MKRIRIAIADNHPLFRRGLMMVLKNVLQLEVVAEAGDGIELLEVIKSTKPDVVLLDLNMPKMDGSEVMQHIKKNKIDIKIIVISMHDEEGFILHSLAQGASGYLLKQSEPDEIISCIEQVIDDGFFFNAYVTKIMYSHIQEPNKKIKSTGLGIELTKREIEVLKYICQELSTKEISEKLYRSERTVEGHRQNLMEKIGAKNVAGLVVYAVRNGYYS